ncbi:MAG: S1 RNA-binding domain-containing protein, partial [Candidatus Omnitrophota bacterium]
MTEQKSELEELYNQSIKIIREGQVVKGKIVCVRTKEVLVDVGFKSEGIVPIQEFAKQDLEAGKELDFFVESMENDAGAITLSRERAMRIQGWDKIVEY